MKLLFLFLSALLMTVSANAQRGLRSRSQQDSTKELYPVQNITYRGLKNSSGKQQLAFILRTGLSTRLPLRVYAIDVDSVKLISANDTITLLNPKADTACIDPAGYIIQEGYCDWVFTFSLTEKQKEFLRNSEVDTVLFFDRKKLRRDELTGSRRKVIMDIIKE
jgi:hypothetical protein